MRSKSVSQEVWGFCACCGDGFTNFLFFFFFVFYSGSYAGFIYFEMVATEAATLNYSTHRTVQYFLVVPWLFSASWEYFQHHLWRLVGLVVLLMVYSIALKKYGRATRDHFCFQRYALSWRDEHLTWREWLLHGHWQCWAHHHSSRRQLRSCYRGRGWTTVNPMRFALTLHLYICLHFSWLWMVSHMCIRFDKFFCDRFVYTLW